jgi:hypothetical protein
VREQRAGLEDRRRVALVGRQVIDAAAIDADRAGIRFLEAADQPQRRCLAGARRPEQVTNSPRLTSIDTSSTATTPPKARLRRSSSSAFVSAATFHST